MSLYIERGKGGSEGKQNMRNAVLVFGLLDLDLLPEFQNTGLGEDICYVYVAAFFLYFGP